MNILPDHSGDIRIDDEIFIPNRPSLGWTLRLTSTDTSILHKVCYSETEGLFAAVGAGVILTSPDGITWTKRLTISSSIALYGVDYSDSFGLFVAVGYDGSALDSVVYTSSDGITWTSRSLPTSGEVLLAVAWSSTLGIFVAVGIADASYYSSDGITWTYNSMNLSTSDFSAVVYSVTEGLFVAVAEDGIDRIASSTDGINWVTRRESGDEDDSSIYYNSVTYSTEEGLFVAVGNNFSLFYIVTSPDGITWTKRTVPSGGPENWRCVTYGTSDFVAVGDGGGTGQPVMSSVNGTTDWQFEQTNDPDYYYRWYGVTFGGGIYVAVGQYNPAPFSTQYGFVQTRSDNRVVI